MKKRRIKNKVVIIVAFLFVIFAMSPTFNLQYGAINEKYKFGGDGAANKIIGDILGAGLGVLGSALSSVVLLVVGLLVLLLSSIFGPMAGTWGFPGIDKIIFNGVALFDPNFINPPDSTEFISLSGLPSIQTLIQKIYYSGYVIGGSIFVIGAMIIGIKLAVTSIASEKAYYKEMIGTWLKGLVLMFTVHIIITGVFKLNETIVNSLADSASSITFELKFEDFGGVGKAIGSIVNFFGNLFGGEDYEEPSVHLPGIEGLTFKLIVRGIFSGDLISAIAVAGLLGQTVSLMITYFKRTIICILLAAVAPYIVAVDFIKKLV